MGSRQKAFTWGISEVDIQKRENIDPQFRDFRANLVGNRGGKADDAGKSFQNSP
jgi:hypothetical protein